VKHVPTVAWRELRSLFVSPVAYGVLSLFAVLAGLFFVLGVAAFNTYVIQLEQYQAMDQLQKVNLSDQLVAQFYDAMGVVLLFLVPGITMGLFAAEKANGTQELLLTSPLTIWDVVLGKFAAGAAFIAILVAMVAAFPGLLFVYGDPEIGKTISGLLGLLLVGWTYVAIGIFASSVTKSQVVSFLIAFVLLLCLLLMPAIAELGVLGGGGGLSGALDWVSSGEHFQQMLKGLVDTRDLAYFAVIIGSFLLLTKASVESVRWR
jgi:gliding motility-associated transport system permease protein